MELFARSALQQQKQLARYALYAYSTGQLLIGVDLDDGLEVSLPSASSEVVIVSPITEVSVLFSQEGISRACATAVCWCGGGRAVGCASKGVFLLSPEGSVSLTGLFLMYVCVSLQASGVEFAPIGLHKMYNGGGAVLSCRLQPAGPGASGKAPVFVTSVRGCGPFLAYCSRRPDSVTTNGLSLFFEYNSETRALHLDVPGCKSLRCDLAFSFEA